MTWLLSDSTCSDSRECCGWERVPWWRPAPSTRCLLDLLRVDLLEGEIHSAGSDGSRREEVVRSVREIVDAGDQLICGGHRQRHRDSLRHRLAHEQAERGAHGNGNEPRRLSDGKALELVLVLDHLLPEAVFRFASDRRNGDTGVDERTHDAIGAALTPNASEVRISRESGGCGGLRLAGIPVADHLDGRDARILLPDFGGALPPLLIDAGALDTIDHQNLALAASLLNEK